MEVSFSVADRVGKINVTEGVKVGPPGVPASAVAVAASAVSVW
jgi:hypothetical protein